MSRIVSTFAGLLLCLATGIAGSQGAEPSVVEVWPGKPVGDEASQIGEEKWLDPRPCDKWQKWVTNVSKPTLTIYRPDADKDNGAAVLICPGGGYHALKSHLHRKEFP